MKTNESYKDKIKARDRCVRINYAGDFHMDIVLAKTSDNDHILIPSKKRASGRRLIPKDFKNGVEMFTMIIMNNLGKLQNYSGIGEITR